MIYKKGMLTIMEYDVSQMVASTVLVCFDISNHLQVLHDFFPKPVHSISAITRLTSHINTGIVIFMDF